MKNDGQVVRLPYLRTSTCRPPSVGRPSDQTKEPSCATIGDPSLIDCDTMSSLDIGLFQSPTGASVMLAAAAKVQLQSRRRGVIIMPWACTASAGICFVPTELQIAARELAMSFGLSNEKIMPVERS